MIEKTITKTSLVWRSGFIALGLVALNPLIAQPGSFRIVSTASVNGHEIGICFSEPVEWRSANDARAYRLSDTNVVVTNAIVRADNQSVVLQLSREIVGYSFILVASGVRDREGTLLANPIVAGSVLGHDTGGLDNTDVGELGVNPHEQGSVFGCTNRLFSRDFEVTAGGAGIGGRTDAFHYVYHRAYQIFEIFAQVNNLTGTNGLAQAGLMVRESLSEESRHVSLLVVSSGGLTGEIAVLRRDTVGGASSEWPGSQKLGPISFPVWLRIRREGSVFFAYASSGDFNWTQLGTFEPAVPFPMWPETAFAGTATSSGNNASGQVVRVQYQYQVSPHGDVFPRIDLSREREIITLRWPSVSVLESSQTISLQGQWIPVTNNIEFGAWNQWRFQIPPSVSHQYFRLRIP